MWFSAIRRLQGTRVLTAIMVASLLTVAIGLAGCSDAEVEAIEAAAGADSQQKACFANQRSLVGAYGEWRSSSGSEATDFAEFEGFLVPDYLEEIPKCPNSGTYTWDPASQTLSCSNHGKP